MLVRFGLSLFLPKRVIVDRKSQRLVYGNWLFKNGTSHHLSSVHALQIVGAPHHSNEGEIEWMAFGVLGDGSRIYLTSSDTPPGKIGGADLAPDDVRLRSLRQSPAALALFIERAARRVPHHAGLGLLRPQPLELAGEPPRGR